MARQRDTVKWVVFAALLMPLASCTFLDSFVPKRGESTDVIDRQQNLTVNDFRDLNSAEKLTKAKDIKDGEVKTTAVLGAVGTPPVPDLAQVLAAPKAPKLANAKLVTISVTEDVPLRDVLFELGRLANVDIELGSGLDKSGINLRATDRPFNEVIERISTLANLRYSVTGNAIRVEKDAPYIKNYPLDFLNIVRSSTSSYNLSTSVLSGGGSSSSGSSSGSSSSSSSSGSGSSGSSSSGNVGTSGSTSGITTQAESDLWAALDASVTEILAYKASGSDDASDKAAAASSASGSKNSNFVINRQAGILSVTATEKQHEMVQRFLTMMSRNSSAQVLIEAKIVEVALTDQFLSGVNWNKVLGDINKTYVQAGQYAASLNDFTAPSNPFTVGIKSGDLDAVITATQHFGTTHTLSSPRLAAINNQQAVLTFATNEVFFDCTYTAPSTTSSSSSSTTSGSTTSTNAPTFNCTHSSVPIGIILSILPSINLDTQEVTLNVRPTLTRKTTDKISPTSAFLRSQVTSSSAAGDIPDTTVPVIQVREIDSITKVKSGGVMVIGGLMEDSSSNDQTGVPGASELPIFGNLFKSRSEDARKTELIIFIKATIVNSDGSTHEVDRAIYNKFVTDPRPLFPKQ